MRLWQIEALAAGPRPDVQLTIWLMCGCGLRVSEALAVRKDSTVPISSKGFVLGVHVPLMAIGPRIDVADPTSILEALRSPDCVPLDKRTV